MFDQSKATIICSKIDFRFAYHQLKIKEGNVSKTAFRKHYVHYEFLIMPFGLTNAPIAYMDMMNRIFTKYLNEFIMSVHR